MTQPSDNLRPDVARLWASLMRSAEIGATPAGGLRRLALSAEDGAMRRLFVQWCEAAGCPVQVDAVGNIYATRAGTDPTARPVLVGSHLDTQIKGGRFDGVLGVLAGLEIVRTLNDACVRTRHPITVVNWTNEEGARFEPPMIGSAVFTGARPAAFAHGRTDRDGMTLGEALEDIGFRGEAVLRPADFDSLWELHIEQGPRLEQAGRQVGVVTGAYGVRGFVVEVRGEVGHSGTTPMPRRRNALVGAARVTLAVEEIGWAHHDEGGKSTTMRQRAEPNLLGILPELVEMTCDVRHPDDAVAAAMFETLKARLPAIAAESHCAIAIKEDWRYGGMRYDPALVGAVREAAEALGYSAMDLLTEAGHDAMHVADHLPTAMIFTQCRDGISHNEAEYASVEQIRPGLDVLLRCVLQRAGVVG